ncbi:SDR family oxidoreductase [Patulibacter sp. SYSU D01012]|uniref:SDR family oxidoreductase n=1 Tax=Patulibacter sp. SYSU D01012 TaxID=2817381 RepID=UPI001B316D26|nr:SDR family oxidoreductase [Patulibacter sp. SYSU D01012]
MLDPAGAVAVVTGGASGIGRALAARLIAEGARGVVVADLDGAGAARVADELGAAARGVACDAARQDDVAAALALAEEAFGPVDLFCANAGVAVGTDEQDDDAVWDLALDVNVRAHVLAARLLVPGWLARGRGCFLATASAAGLLTQVGSAPYAVSKHAAVAFAEWLAVTYGDRGIQVACLCPMGVDTPLLSGGFADGGSVAADAVRTSGAVLTPDAVARVALDGLRAGRFLLLPHPEVATFERHRTADRDRWLAGMRRLQRGLRTDG